MHETENSLTDYLQLGLIQTTTNAEIAWQNYPKMTPAESDHAWREIRHGFHILSEMDVPPQFILLPNWLCRFASEADCWHCAEK